MLKHDVYKPSEVKFNVLYWVHIHLRGKERMNATAITGIVLLCFE
jgi:hypothetical protein